MLAADQVKAVRRLKSIEGHVRGVARMVQEDQYCVDIIKQILAIQGALQKLNLLILETHLEQCVTVAMRSESPSERERVIRELLGMFAAAEKL